MNMTRKLFFVFILFFSFVRSASAIPWQKVPDPMKARGSFVQDSASILSASEIQNLDSISKNLEAKTSIELAVVTVDSLEGISIEEYAVKLFERLGIGKKGKDNGALILFALKDRKVRIEVGYGLEETLTDARSQQLLNSFAIPQFKTKQYAQGISDLAQAVAETAGRNRESSTENLAINHFESHDDIDKQISPEDEGKEALRSSGINLSIFGYSLALLTSCLGLVLAISLPQFFKKARSAKLQYLRKVKITSIVLFVVSFFLLSFFFVRSIYPLFIALPVWGLIMIPLYKILKYRALNYQLTCSNCSNKMDLVPEFQDDKWLSEEEADEEIAKGMDYEFWQCPQCSATRRFNVKLAGAKPCPKCARRSLVKSSKVITDATTSSSGLRQCQEDCKNRRCDYFKEWQETIPRIRSSSGSGGSSSRSSGSSFGGGRSGGGGASGSW